jgi:rare lipoprotein A
LRMGSLFSRSGRAVLVALILVAARCASRPRARTTAEEAVSVPGAHQRGLASWYGAEFAGLPTASGEIFRPEKVSAAHRTLPLGTVVDVKNEKNGRAVRVAVNDRGPFVAGRIIDLSKAGAEAIGSVSDGVVPVTLTVISLGTNRRVRAVDSEGNEASPSRGWAVQAGAFASEENALRLRDRLAARYPNPYLEEFQGLKRVKFGPYRKREEADAASASLEELGLAGIIVAYR